MAQLAAADREIHVKLSEKTRSGLPLGPQGELPLDQYVQQVLEMPAVMWLLMPKPKSALAERPSGAGPKPAPKKPAAPDDKKVSSEEQQVRQRPRASVPKHQCQHSCGGGTPIDNENRSICYGFNLGSCHDKACKRGRHVCCKPGCFSASHNFLNHDKASWLKPDGMRSFAVAGSASFVKQLTDNSQVTKVTSATFPTEDVIQDRPVFNVAQAEHQPQPFYTQLNVADLQSGGKHRQAGAGRRTTGKTRRWKISAFPAWVILWYCGRLRPVQDKGWQRP